MPNISEIRAKYPQYDDMSDAELAVALHKKFYADMPEEEFNKKIGFDPAEANRGTFLDPLMQGAFLGASDEIRAGVRSGAKKLFGAEEPIGDIYNTELEGGRKNLEAYRKRHPVLAPVAEVGGAVGSALATRMPSAIGTAGTALGKAGMAALEGAGYGGAYGFNAGEGGLQNRLESAGTGAAVGAAGGAAVQGAVGAVGARAAASAAQRAAAQKAQQEAASFGVPLSRGQATQDVAQVAREESLRNNALGNAGGERMRQFDQGQGEAIDNAVRGVGDRMTGGQAVGDPVDLIPEALRAKAEQHRATANLKRQEATDIGAALKPEALKDAKVRAETRLNEQGRIIDPQLTPSASRAMQELDDFGNLRGGLQGPPKGDGKVVGVSLDGIEQTRKRLGKLVGSTPEDRAAVIQIKRAFDEWLDDAVDNSLFSGDPAALKALKEYRGEWTAYRKLTGTSTEDAQKAIIKMVKGDRTAGEVANFLYGSSVFNAPGRSVRIASRLKDTFGEGSKEWQAIRAGAWQRITNGARAGEKSGNQKLANDILEFVRGKGKALADVLFTPQEQAEMQKLAMVLKHTVPAKEATNPSKSGYTAKRLMGSIGDMLLAGGGLATGGVPGGLAMMFAMPIFRHVNSLRVAGQATSQALPKVSRGLPKSAVPVAYGTAAAITSQ